MTESRFQSEQYTSEQFVESVGAVLFRPSSREVCVLHFLERDEYVLAKGRRNCVETRQATAAREVSEETGFACRLLPVTMYTRAPPAVETQELDDRTRFYTDVCKPFTLQIRRVGEGHVKLIWWFVAAVNEDVPQKDTLEGGRYSVEFCSYEAVLDRVTFQMDRDMVKRAIEFVENTYMK
jgi:8-oxo-dGTP pyrophosphatase MutT (NUDIX family)